MGVVIMELHSSWKWVVLIELQLSYKANCKTFFFLIMDIWTIPNIELLHEIKELFSYIYSTILMVNCYYTNMFMM
jgi:hypothetical protein